MGSLRISWAGGKPTSKEEEGCNPVRRSSCSQSLEPGVLRQHFSKGNPQPSHQVLVNNTDSQACQIKAWGVGGRIVHFSKLPWSLI